MHVTKKWPDRVVCRRVFCASAFWSACLWLTETIVETYGRVSGTFHSDVCPRVWLISAKSCAPFWLAGSAEMSPAPNILFSHESKFVWEESFLQTCGFNNTNFSTSLTRPLCPSQPHDLKLVRRQLELERECRFIWTTSAGFIHPSIHPFSIPAKSNCRVAGGGWSLSQPSLGERQGTPWTGCQSITGPHRDKWPRTQFRDNS